jgi:hypothetical protein
MLFEELDIENKINIHDIENIYILQTRLIHISFSYFITNIELFFVFIILIVCYDNKYFNQLFLLFHFSRPMLQPIIETN